MATKTMQILERKAAAKPMNAPHQNRMNGFGTSRHHSAREHARTLLDLRELALHPLTAWLTTLALLGIFTWFLRFLDIASRSPRPYTIFYLIPVAIGASLLGLRGGLISAALSVLLARAFLFVYSPGIGNVSGLDEGIELTALTVGSTAIALVTGRMHTILSKLHEVSVSLMESEERRRLFNREVLLAVTGGRLQLYEPDELERLVPNEPVLTMELNGTREASDLRGQLKRIVEEHHLSKVRLDDLSLAAMEAAANAVKHGNGGTARVWVGNDKISVLIADHGTGISPADLARATLERGFSTRVSLGMGFYLMLESVDLLALSTSPKGTSILLVVGSEGRPSMEENLLARYM